ncbi:NAD binding domain of 6-phosphogluconate dehydrogenase-domain-containing protein [Lasiosphaeria ovina]|uniref:NAD binding domain of 6-phosphogluconate dehydrogenase-domain-containing protein n=1 Tax=Lasiosphaeria ovina TaxID=92902 RepID=A0AAE0NEA4_9PEZI|nr:NAD binding domain of 6-phosphogluconate dehydrogenase-domain-containing protein [Lasiosphaeria ovina]
MALRLFWIGLGNMGRGMCKNIVEKANLDQPLLIYNRTRQRSVELSEKLGADKTAVVDSVAEGVAQADVIITCVANDKAMEATVDEIIKQGGDIAGKLFVDCSTIHPDTTERVGKALTDKGAEFVAGPVFGAAAMAESGMVISVLAGPKASVDRARPYFKGVTARAEIDMSGEPWGKALLLKVTGNAFILGMVEMLAEGHVLAEKTGLGTKYLDSLVGNMFGGPFGAYSGRLVSGDYYKRDPPAFAVDLARKDAGHALSLAKAAGTRMRIVEVADEHLKLVKEHVGENGDLAGIYGAIRLEAGLDYRNEA